jgi:hypothetical protein
MTESEMLLALARELGVAPQKTGACPMIGLKDANGAVYSWIELVLVHVRLLKSALDPAPGASE